MADKYGILLWDEFFQPNPLDGPDVDRHRHHIANVTDKVVRFRNHPSIAIWCARNEGYPPKELDDTLHALMDELDPTRLYQSNSSAGRGVASHGPYYWRSPLIFLSDSRSLQDRNRLGFGANPRIDSGHDAPERLGDDQRRLGPARHGGRRATRQRVPYFARSALRPHSQPRRFCAQRPARYLRSISRHVRRAQSRNVSDHHRNHYLDEPSGAAQFRLAVVSLRSGAERGAVRREESGGNRARPIERGKFRNRSGEQQT